MSQKKEQDATSVKELSEKEISNLPDQEFKVMVIKILTRLKRRVDELRGNFNKNRKYKRKQSEKNRKHEMKNTL